MNKKEILMQPNNLIKSKYDFTSVENKFFYKLLYNAQKQSGSSPLYEAIISTEEIKKFMKRTNDTVYSGVNDILNLFKQSIMEFEYIDEKTGDKKIFSSGLVVSSSFNSESQIYEIQIHEILYKHITNFMQMQKEGLGYTALNLSVLFNFRGAYSQRMYTLLRMWTRQDKEVEVKYSISKLREYLKISSDLYPAYKNFKQKVINKSIDEINRVGNMKVEIKEEIKKGRKAEEIVFKVIDFEPRKYFEFKNLEELPEIDRVQTQKKSENDIEVIDFYIPNKKLFTPKTLESFKNDFKDYDFTDKKLKQLLQEAILVALEKDDEEKIKVKSYDYFKGTLNNKISDLNKKNYNKAPKVTTRFHNINETFRQYEPNELEKGLKEGQKVTFGSDSPLHRVYLRALENGLSSLPTDASRKNILEYAEKNGLEIPKN